jgi:hypothetical protein
MSAAIPYLLITTTELFFPEHDTDAQYKRSQSDHAVDVVCPGHNKGAYFAEHDIRVAYFRISRVEAAALESDTAVGVGVGVGVGAAVDVGLMGV